MLYEASPQQSYLMSTLKLLISAFLFLALPCIVPSRSNATLLQDIDNLGQQAESLRAKYRYAERDFAQEEIQPGLKFISYTHIMAGVIPELSRRQIFGAYIVEAEVLPPPGALPGTKWVRVRHIKEGIAGDVQARLISSWGLRSLSKTDFKPGDFATIMGQKIQHQPYDGRVVKVLARTAPRGMLWVRHLDYPRGNQLEAKEFKIWPALLLPLPQVTPKTLEKSLFQNQIALSGKPLQVITPTILKWVNARLKLGRSQQIPLDDSEVTMGYLRLGRAIIDHPDFRASGFLKRMELLSRFARAVLKPSHSTLGDLRNNEFDFQFSDLLLIGRGVCQEISEFVGLLMLEAGYSPVYRWSVDKTGAGHGWISTTHEDFVYIIDAINNIIGKRSDIIEQPRTEISNYYFDHENLVFDSFPLAPDSKEECDYILSRLHEG